MQNFLQLDTVICLFIISSFVLETAAHSAIAAGNNSLCDVRKKIQDVID